MSSRSPLYRGIAIVISGLMSRNIWSAAEIHDVHRTFAHGDGRVRRRRRRSGWLFWPRPPRPRPPKVGSDSHAFGDGGFEQFHGLFGGGAADVAGADVLIVGINAGQFAIDVDALHPIGLARAASAASGRRVGIGRRRGRRLFAEIGGDVASRSRRG